MTRRLAALTAVPPLLLLLVAAEPWRKQLQAQLVTPHRR